ncbi:MAG: tetratricopeptide repeat protein [Myxococcales bacterium]|nr:tetratricopeptide repeat protein [Myxococcales bacterium]
MSSNTNEITVRARQYYHQGLAFEERGQFSEAIEALQAAVRTAPENIEARIDLGRVLLKRGRAEDGLRVLDQGLARENVSTVNRRTLLESAARCSAAVGRYRESRQYLERALELAEDQPEVLNQVAAVCCKGGQFEEGFDYFLKAASKS